MTYVFARWLVNALALLAAAYLVPGIVVESIYIALIAALLLGLVNAFLRPVLFILTLPITILTLGLFTFVLNALLFWFVASFVDGFEVDGFLAALVGSLLVSIVSAFGSKLLVKTS